MVVGVRSWPLGALSNRVELTTSSFGAGSPAVLPANLVLASVLAREPVVRAMESSGAGAQSPLGCPGRPLSMRSVIIRARRGTGSADPRHRRPLPGAGGGLLDVVQV